jgi:hypothetical protein
MSRLKTMNEVIAKASTQLGLRPPQELRLGQVVCVARRHFTTYTEALEEIRCFDGEGWVTYTDQVCELRSHELEDQRIALRGEWCNEQQTLTLRRDRSGWSLWTLETQASEDEWLSEVNQLKLPRGRLVYEVSWQLREDGSRFPSLSRLIRIEQDC